MIGDGAFGVVYRTWDTILNRAVALKRPRPGAIAGREDIEGFLREARNAPTLRHPQIVRVHDAGQVDRLIQLNPTVVAYRMRLRECHEAAALIRERQAIRSGNPAGPST